VWGFETMGLSKSTVLGPIIGLSQGRFGQKKNRVISTRIQMSGGNDELAHLARARAINNSLNSANSPREEGQRVALDALPCLLKEACDKLFQTANATFWDWTRTGASRLELERKWPRRYYGYYPGEIRKAEVCGTASAHSRRPGYLLVHHAFGTNSGSGWVFFLHSHRLDFFIWSRQSAHPPV